MPRKRHARRPKSALSITIINYCCRDSIIPATLVINCRRAENEIGTILKSWGGKVAGTYLFMPLGC